MNVQAVFTWLCDYYLLATPLLAAVCLATALMRQPARRLSIVWAAAAGLVALGALCAAPGWSFVHLIETRGEAPAAMATPPTTPSPAPAAQPAKAEAPLPPMAPRALTARPAESAPASGAGGATAAMPWPSIVVASFGGGSSLVALWFTVGYARARSLLRGARVAPGRLVEVLRVVAGGRAVRARLRTHERLSTPVALGLARPTIILPAAMADNDSQPKAAAALAHELAHVRNGDLWLLAGLRGLTLALWAHPLFWLLRRTVRGDQEALADAAAAELTTRHDYAAQLVAWARALPERSGTRIAPAVGLWEGPSQLKRRVAMLLDEKFTVLTRCSRGWRATTLAACAVGALGLSLVTLAPAQPEPEDPQASSDSDEPDGGASDQGTAPDVTATFTSIPPTGAAIEFEEGPHEPNTLSGQCVDAQGAPLRDVRLTIYRADRLGAIQEVASTTSGPDGAFSISNAVADEDLPPEDGPAYRPNAPQFVFVAQREGRVSQHFQAAAPTYASGVRLTVTLEPGATLTGVVTDPNGEPVAGALVTAARGGVSTVIEGVQTARTDEQGRYEIRDAAPFDREAFEKLRAEREKNRDVLTLFESHPARLPHYYNTYNVLTAPPVLHVSHPDYATKKAPYEAIPGETNVQLEPAEVIEGRVLDVDGAPAPGLTVSARTALTAEERREMQGDEAVYLEHFTSTSTDDEGRYRFTSLPAGRYDIHTDPLDRSSPMPEWLPSGVSGFTALGFGGGNRVPDIQLQRGGVIEIQLENAETGEPLSFDPPGYAWVSIEKAGVPDLIGYRSAKAPCGADGLVRVRSLPGEVSVTVHGAGHESEGTTPTWRSPAGQSRGIEVTIAPGDTTSTAYPLEDHSAQDEAHRQVQRGSAALESGDVDEALRIWSEAINKHPGGMAEVSLRRSRAELWERRHEYPNAVADYEAIVAISPSDVGALAQLAWRLATCPDDSVRDGERAMEMAQRTLDVLLARSPDGRWRGHQLMAAAYAELGDFSKAVTEQKRAVESAPNANTRFQMERALRLYESGKPLRGDSWRLEGEADLTAAVEFYSGLLAEEPENPEYLTGRAHAHQRLGHTHEAISDYEAVLKAAPDQVTPNNPVLANNLAWLLATAPDERDRDGVRAVKLAQQAVAAAPDSAQTLDTLAAAYAEAGQFDKAVETQRAAIEKASPEQAEEMRGWLRAYEQRTPRRAGAAPPAPPTNGESASAPAAGQSALLVASVVDAQTGEPIPKFQALAGTSPLEDLGWQWQPHTLHEFTGGRLQWPPPGRRGYGVQRIRVEASGYVPHITPVVKDATSNEPRAVAAGRILSVEPGQPAEITIRMQRDPGIRARVLTPEGEPAAGAQVGIAMAAREAPIRDGALRVRPVGDDASPSDRWRRPVVVEADDQGWFTLPDEVVPAAVAIAHSSGFVAMNLMNLKQAAPEVRLEPWGAVAGRVVWGDTAGARESLWLNARTSVGGTFGLVLSMNAHLTTDADGAFFVDKVPPGLAQVSRTVDLGENYDGDSFMPNQFIDVAAGESTDVVFGGRGRPVTGRLVGRDDWSGVTVRAAPNAPRPGFMANQRDPTWPAYTQFLASTAGKNYVKKGVPVDAAGRFRIENVPPEYYQLFVDAEGADQSIGYATFRVETIPGGESDAPLDVGELRCR